MRRAVERVARVWSRLPAPRYGAVIVLGWHRVDDEDIGLAVAPSVFRDHMDRLVQSRREVLADADAAVAHARSSRPDPAVLLTFDDAWSDNAANAWPVLAERRLPATLYVPSALIGTAGYLTLEQLRAAHDHGIVIGGHSRTHPDLRRCSDRELDDEVRGGREELEDMIGRAVTSFAYPKGLEDPRVCAAVRKAGYTSAVTTRRGWMTQRSDVWHLPRSFVENIANSTFDAALDGGLNALGVLDRLRAS